MIEIKVLVEIPGIPEALNRLADAISAACTVQQAAPVVPAEETATPAVVSDHGKRRRATKEKPAEAVEEQQAAPDPAPVAAAAPAPAVNETPMKEYTLEQISKAGLALMDAGRLNDLMSLLQKHGIQALTAADPSQYAAIAADLIAMGGVI